MRLRLGPGALVYDGHLLVRATMNLPGLRRGQHALVDPRSSYIAGALRSQALVPAERTPDDWNCVRCGKSDGRTQAGGLLCSDCHEEPSGAAQTM